MSRRIESHMIQGPVGRLEALLEEPEDREPAEAVVVCHPHPQHGGTMHNKVVYRMARGLRKAGSVVLRFNFRGVNLSEGAYGRGMGEVEDARAALGWLRDRYPDLPFALAGFSFGSRVILRLGCSVSGASRLIATGYPAGYKDQIDLSHCAVPKFFVQSTNDEFGPRAEMERFLETVGLPREVHWVEAEDHFFKGALDDFETVMRNLRR